MENKIENRISELRNELQENDQKINAIEMRNNFISEFLSGCTMAKADLKDGTKFENFDAQTAQFIEGYNYVLNNNIGK